MYRFNYCQNLPDLYNDYFKQNNELHNYNTRNSTKLHVSYKRTNYRKYTVFNKGVSIWNCLDEEIKNIKSYFSFKKTAKSYYLMSEEVGQLISELSRELSTNEIALFSIVLSAEFGQKNLHSTENKSEKNINIKIFLQNLKCCSSTTKDLLISAKICEVNFIFNVILMFEVSRLPTTC